MASEYTVDDLMDFLTHASDRGLIPAATAQSLAVASRNVFGVLAPTETPDLRTLDIEGVVKRFTNKRARDFNPSSLKEYGRRVHRAVDLYLQWRNDPASFSVKTRVTNGGRRKELAAAKGEGAPPVDRAAELQLPFWSANGGREVVAPDAGAAVGAVRGGGYTSAIPIRPGCVVSLINLPHDLTSAEAERLAQFVRMLVVE